MDKPEFIQMLMALRAQIEAQHATITAALSVLVGEPRIETEGPCRHPPDQRINTSTQGGPRKFFCRACNTEFEEVF